MNVTPDVLAVSVGGRWGRRRVRVTECAYVLRAEALYDQRLRAGLPYAPGDCGQARVIVQGRLLAADWMTVPNRLWAHGRVFLLCAKCEHRVTRLYLVTLQSARLECRRCLGLTYWSRTHGDYRQRGGWLDNALGVAQADWTRLHTSEERRSAKAAARVRYQERRVSSIP